MGFQTPAKDFDRLFYGSIAAVFGLAVFMTTPIWVSTSAWLATLVS